MQRLCVPLYLVMASYTVLPGTASSFIVLIEGDPLLLCFKYLSNYNLHNVVAATLLRVIRFISLLDAALVFGVYFVPLMCLLIRSNVSVFFSLKAIKVCTVKSGGNIISIGRTIQNYLQVFVMYNSLYYMAINMFGIAFFLFLGVLIMCNTLLLLSRVILQYVSFSVFCEVPFVSLMVTFFVASAIYYPTMFYAKSYNIILLMKGRFSRYKCYRLKVRSLRPIRYGIGFGTNSVCFFDRNTFLEFFNVVYTKSASVFIIMIVLKNSGHL